LLTSCALKPVPDWETFYARQPRSILVVPAENETTEVEAPRFFMATIARPLIARGYYVYPVEATSEILASEGFTAGAELTQVPPERFLKYFGADGVLFVTIKTWDTVYAVLSSAVTVTLQYQLVDTHSGETVWSGIWTAQKRSGGGYGGDPIGALVAMAVDAALTAALTDYMPLARQASASAAQSLAPGVYHPQYEATKNRLIGEWKEYKKRKAEEDAKKKAEDGQKEENGKEEEDGKKGQDGERTQEKETMNVTENAEDAGAVKPPWSAVAGASAGASAPAREARIGVASSSPLLVLAFISNGRVRSSITLSGLVKAST